ncbi:MAG: indole-3-glycerol phosphate synthase TrpC [Bacteroidales bacterium]|nr:indole-3-glycerol phosphate synthase TrpC [Bacteroidales bacterium]
MTPIDNSAVDILQTIVTAKRLEVDARRQVVPIEHLSSQCAGLTRGLSLKQALLDSPTGIIAEFKRKSPSKGYIFEGAKVSEVVPAYAAAGCAGISVLTDYPFFGGSIRDLKQARSLVNVPLLRKDFIIDPYQVYESKLLGADVILLIAAILTPDEAYDLGELAHELGLEVLLEVHTAEELAYVSRYTDMVGVNNRRLQSFHTNVQTSFDLAASLPEGIVLVSESGLGEASTLKELRAVGYRGFLMGEAFMKTGQPGAALRSLVNDLTDPFLKVCGLREPANIQAVADLKPTHLGFIFYPPSPRAVRPEDGVTPALLANLKAQGITPVAVVVDEPFDTLLTLLKTYGFDTVQLHGREFPSYCAALKEQGYTVIKAFSMESQAPLASTAAIPEKEAILFESLSPADYEGTCSYFLFDTKTPGKGGSGQRFDWSQLEAYQGSTGFLLSGGLGPDTVEDLLAFTHPRLAGYDLNSRFELAPGLKDVSSLRTFKNELGRSLSTTSPVTI